MDYKKEVAIFGGTFDPPTRAHEAIVQACLEQPGIDEVWLMTSGQRIDKPNMSSESARLAMVELMIITSFGANPRLKTCDIERHLPQPTHTAQTYAVLQETYPTTHFWFVFGADSYHDMPRWRHGEALQKNMAMLIMERAGFELPPETSTLQHLPLHELQHPVSSTQVRQCAKTGADVAPFVSKAVGNFISRTALYL